jgi:hypothetical protein
MLKQIEDENPTIKKETGWISKTILVLRYMIAYKIQGEDPF